MTATDGNAFQSPVTSAMFPRSQIVVQSIDAEGNDAKYDLISKPVGSYLLREYDASSVYLSYHSSQLESTSSGLPTTKAGRGSGSVQHVRIFHDGADGVFFAERKPNAKYPDLGHLLSELPFIHFRAEGTSAIFPQWVLERDDFQSFFPRFKQTGRVDDRATLEALVKVRDPGQGERPWSR
jgi:hypothetical protein